MFLEYSKVLWQHPYIHLSTDIVRRMRSLTIFLPLFFVLVYYTPFTLGDGEDLEEYNGNKKLIVQKSKIDSWPQK